MTDYGLEAHKAAEERLEMLDQALMAEEVNPSAARWPADLLAPYCGCLTCQVRETLIAAWPHIEAAVMDGFIWPVGAESSAQERQT